MRQHQVIALLVTLAAALAVPATGASAPADAVRGPGCGDIMLSDPDQTGPPIYSTGNPQGSTPATVHALLTTAKPSCSSLTYTISVYDETGTTLLVSRTYSGDGTTSSFSFTEPIPGAPQRVCIAATSNRDGRVVDAAPNSGCHVLVLDGGSGGQSGID